LVTNVDFQIMDGGLLSFADDIVAPEPDIRHLQDALAVLADNVPVEKNRPLYYMYRGVFRDGDQNTFNQHQIRYDITVLVPGAVGREYIKTVGHFHPLKPNSSETFPEYYEVLAGEALYLLQRNNKSGEVEEIMAVEAKAGDKVYIPSGFGHVTINPGEGYLVMANLIEKNFSSQYGPFRDKRGAAYYYVKGDNGKGEFVRNGNYHNSVGLKMVPAPHLPQPVEAVKNQGLYSAFMADPAAFAILR